MSPGALRLAGFAVLGALLACHPRSQPPVTQPPVTQPTPKAANRVADQIAQLDSPLRELLAAPALAPTLARAPELRLQVVLGWLEETPEGRRVLRQQSFRADAEYFYPASSVKLFAAVAALEQLGQWRAQANIPATGREIALVFHPLFPGEEREEHDASHLEGGQITIQHEIRKLFLVSDNEAFNRLYELVGQDGLAASLERAGLGQARIVHRLAERRSPLENRQMPAIDLFDLGHQPANPTWSLPRRESAPLPPLPPIAGLEVGQAYLQDDRRIDQPMDFSEKNRISLVDLQRGLCKVLFPAAHCGPGANFALGPADREFLATALSQYPGDSPNPRYDRVAYPDDYAKFLLPGLRRELPATAVRLYNKFGQAYGFSTENAWVVDTRTGRGYFLAATLYTNADRTLNDDRYEYTEFALPFYADLGQSLGQLLGSSEFRY